MSSIVNTGNTDPTAGVNFPDPTQIPLSGLPPWITAVLQQIPGMPVGSAPATGTSPSSSSSFPWSQVAGAAATGLGAYLNYAAQNARNNLLQQQISSNNAISQADQARRDYYASILMPSILQGLRNNNPQTLAAVQGQQNQSMHFPAPLQFSGTGVTAGTQAPLPATGVPTTAAGFTQAAGGNSGSNITGPNSLLPGGGNSSVSSGGVDPWGNPVIPTSPYQGI